MVEDSIRGKGALDAFLNLFSLITLGWMSISIGIILFQIIDKFLNPEYLDFNNFSQSGLKIGIASVLIITPIFLLVIGLLHKNYKNKELNPESGIYRWLTYLVLLITALNIVGRLIQLVFQFLDGEYTIASVLKILVVLLIAGGIFGYYWYDLKRTDYGARSMVSVVFFDVIIIIAIAAIVGGFFISDSPATARAKKQDVKRVEHLSGIHQTLISEYSSNDELPVDLSAPKFSNYRDPETGDGYTYKVIEGKDYELCAEFALAVDEDSRERFFIGSEDWYFHEAGYQCFQQSATDINRKLSEPIR
jgi:hypothetical protein